METEAYPFTAGGRQLARALVGIDHGRMVDLILKELPEEDVRALALVLLAAEHPRYTETPESIFEGTEPQPDSLARIARLEEEVGRLQGVLDQLHAIFA